MSHIALAVWSAALAVAGAVFVLPANTSHAIFHGAMLLGYGCWIAALAVGIVAGLRWPRVLPVHRVPAPYRRPGSIVPLPLDRPRTASIYDWATEPGEVAA